MPLPSQVARPSSAIGRANMHRTRPPLGKPILIGVGVLCVLGLGGWVLTRGGSPNTPATATAKQPETKPAPDKVLATNDPVPPPAKPVVPPPVEVHQGKAGQADQPVGSSAPQQGTGAPALGHTPGVVPNPKPAAPATMEPKPAAPVAPSPNPIGPAAPTALPPNSAPASGLSASAPAEVQATVAAAAQKMGAGDAVAARVLFSRALADDRLSEADRQTLRNELTTINTDLVFSARLAKDDPYAAAYAVQGGDSLIKIAQKLGLGPDYRFIARINGMKDAHSLHEGQKLKVIKGPFHVIVNKSAYRMDVYMGPPDKPSDWVYVRSFRVGLGEANGTPIGTFTVKKGSKLIDPPWINPHTGEKFAGGDPKNPIGHRWVGLEGLGDAAKFTGYGIHGTIDPDSIGQQRSMGCVRMANEDIDVVWELMGQQVSVVKIVP